MNYKNKKAVDKALDGIDEIMNSNYNSLKELQRFNEVTALLTPEQKKRARIILETEKETKIAEKSGAACKGIPSEYIEKVFMNMNHYDDPTSVYRFIKKMESGKYFKKP